MLRTTPGLQLLGPPDLARMRQLLHHDPVVNAFVDYRVETTGLDTHRLGAPLWGYVDDQGELVSACHVGANLVPVQATPDAARAFAQRAAAAPRTSSSVVGLAEAVLPMWDRLEPAWGPAREVRADQPFLVAAAPPVIRPDPRVRRVLLDEFELLYPSSVAMFLEEVGVSPEADGASHYRARVARLITRGWSFARIDDGEVVFKAEVGLATRAACQVQGVYVHPAHRGRGIAAPAMAAVLDIALREIAPIVSLYVNAANTAARRAYERAGFRQLATFATILF